MIIKNKQNMKFEDTLARMKSLYNYGSDLNENKKLNTHSIEYSATAADGNTYGIIRENSKYYIKLATKGKETIAESYNYLGGFCNKKNYEYNSYANALKNFELKMASINEACDANVNTNIDNFQNNLIITEGTQAMKDEIARQRQIMYNASMIMNESNDIDVVKYNGKQPEAEKGKKGDENFNKKTSANPMYAGSKTNGINKRVAPFDNNPSKSKDQMQEGCDCSNCCCGEKDDWGSNGMCKGKDPQSIGWNIDGQSCVDEEENDWGSEGLPSTPGVGEPNTRHNNNPFEKSINEEESDFDDDLNNPEDDEFDDEEYNDEYNTDEFDNEEDDNEYNTDEFDDEEDDEEDSDIYDEFSDLKDDFDSFSDDFNSFSDEFGDDFDSDDEGDEYEIISDEDDDYNTDEFDDEEDDNEYNTDEFDDEEDDDEYNTDEFDDEEDDNEYNTDEFDDEEDDDEYGTGDGGIDECGLGYDSEISSVNESKKAKMNRIVEGVVNKILKEDELHVFGKHPGYRKKPMELPSTGEDKNQWGRDWNDNSVYSEEPFGSKIGKSSPFDILVSQITKDVMYQLNHGEAFSGKKKVE